MGQSVAFYEILFLLCVVKNLVGLASLGVIILCGCTATRDAIDRGLNESPTVGLLRGDVSRAEYTDRLTQANENARAEVEIEANLSPSRAYNTRTGRYEFAPEGANVQWNDEARRWEFTPADRAS